MAELLFEIHCEEIPARMQAKAAKDLANLVGDGLKKSGLTVGDLKTFAGPRRLTLVADIPLRSPDISEERKGPRVGSPEQALAGFMRGAGITDISQAEIRSDKKGEHYVAVIEKSGEASADIIAALLPSVMTNFPWPKSMKSGTTTFRWVRPLQSLLCILDGNVVDFEVNGFKSGNTTRGHRRMAKSPDFTITDFADYKNTLETDGFVLVDAADRQTLILRDAQAACAKSGLELVEDAGLLAEVSGLAEWPSVILGDMAPEFLELPSEVIRLSMRTHQKYFAVRDPKTGKLAPNFIVVANQTAPDGGVAIAKGNSRVLSARLADAVFFQSEDVRDGKTLESHYKKLDGVVFHQKLGSIKNKSERVARLARELAPKVGADADKAEQAAKLAKCDLVTNMVVEFTSLQGQIGRLMAEREGIDADICTAIEDHYKPQGPKDSVPTNPVAVAVALADKLDMLTGFWAIDEKPTGSKDPYALRRAALGVVRIILENGIQFEEDKLKKSLETWVSGSMFGFVLRALSFEEEMNKQTQNDIFMALWRQVMSTNEHSSKQGLEKIIKSLDEHWSKQRAEDLIAAFLSSTAKSSDLIAFIQDRLKGHLRDEGIKHDVLDAVFALKGDDLVDISNRAKALQAFLSTDEGANLLAGYKRASNILKAEAKKGELPTVEITKGTQGEESALFMSIVVVAPEVVQAVSAEDYQGAMAALAELRRPVDAFFEAVTVNSDEKSERDNRLAMLMRIKQIAGTIADFDKIEG